MIDGWPAIPHFVAIASVILSAQVFAADPSLSTLEPQLTELARAARGEVGVSLFRVETGARLFSFNGKQPFTIASVYKLPIAYEGAIAFEMIGVAEPPPQSEWTLDVQRELIKKVPPLDLAAARARYTADLRDTATPDDMISDLGAAVYESFTGNALPPPVGPARRAAGIKKRSAPRP
jgi:beta-lactamase class A